MEALSDWISEQSAKLCSYAECLSFQLHIPPVHSVTLMLKLCHRFIGKSSSFADTHQIIRLFVDLACS